MSEVNKITITPELAKKAILDENWCIENLFRIRDTKGELVNLKFNQPQKLFNQRAKGKQFVYVIKARKMGLSTRIIAKFIHRCFTRRNVHAVLLTHSDDAAAKMLSERIKPMINNSEIPLGAKITNDGAFFPENDSRLYVGTAGSRKFGRGDDINLYHLSEYAHWESPEVQTGVEEACIEGAEGYIETTTNGVNFAKTLWENSKLGKTRYTPIFLPWYADDRYRLPGATLSDLTDEEQKLMEAFGLTIEQVAWRRGKLRNMSQPELFPQEYPSNDAECFLSSGRMVFDWISLMRQEQNCDPPKVNGFLRDISERVELVPGSPDRLKVWRAPQEGHVYLIGADIAEGLEDGAYSAAVVLDVGEGVQVAEWHGHIAPDLFADELVKLGRYYNNAILVPESWPGPGAVTMQEILNSGYSNYYTDPDRNKRIAGAPREGWETNRKSKQDAILALAAGIRDFKLTLRSKDLISEMRSFVYDAKGHMVPSLGCFSDRVMAAAIAYRVSMEYEEKVRYHKSRVTHAISGRRGVGATFPRFKGVLGVRKD